MNAAAIARRLGGQRQGNNWRCLCPLECGYSLSLSDGEGGKLLAFCYGGHEYNEVLSALVEYGLLDDAWRRFPCVATSRCLSTRRQ